MRRDLIASDWQHRPTHQRVWTLATPMIVSNLSVPLVGLVDSIVAGHLPHAAQLAAVAVGSAVYALPVWICGFLRMGTVGFAAQASGRGDGDTLRRVLAQALVLAVLLSVLLLMLASPLLQPTLALMQPSAQLDGLTRDYLHLRLFGLPAALANYALVGWFLGAQKARVALGVLLITNGINIALNLLFVPVFGWGVPGIAAASVCGEWCGVLFGLACVPNLLRAFPGHLHLTVMRRWTAWRPLLGVNRDIFLRSLVLQGVGFALVVLATRLGGALVAANALLLNGLMLTSFALDGLANAVEALTGHAIGARDRVALRRALVVAGGWSLLGSVLFCTAFAVAGNLFVDVQTSITTVRQTAYAYLPWLAALPPIAMWSYLLDGLFVGATRAREMRNAMLIAGAAFVLLVWSTRPLGNHGLWLAYLGFMLVRAASMACMAWSISARDGWMHAHE